MAQYHNLLLAIVSLESRALLVGNGISMGFQACLHGISSDERKVTGVKKQEMHMSVCGYEESLLQVYQSGQSKIYFPDYLRLLDDNPKFTQAS